MNEQFTLLTALQETLEAPADSIVSKTIYTSGSVRVVLFAFAPGQELTEHTSTREALIHVIDGSALITLGGEAIDASAGTLIRMAPNLPHSVQAQSPMRMLLYMLGK
ncbi:MAG: cupin domain-containing protein [Caldilinea sp.]|nr:cupin domain-containing protein [Anaerolineales bacterium]